MINLTGMVKGFLYLKRSVLEIILRKQNIIDKALEVHNPTEYFCVDHLLLTMNPCIF